MIAEPEWKERERVKKKAFSETFALSEICKN